MEINNKGIDDAINASSEIRELGEAELNQLIIEMQDNEVETKPKNSAINDKGKLIPRVLIKDFLVKFAFSETGIKLLHYSNGTYFIWNGKCYDRKTKEEVGLIFFKWCTENSNYEYLVSNHILSEALTHIQSETYLKGAIQIPSFLKNNEKHPGNYVNLTNGLLNIVSESNELIEHDPDLFTLSTLPVEYNSRAGCSIFLKYLEEVQPDPEIRKLLQQWLGYNLVYSYKFHNFMLFVGEGANGKSVFCTVMAALLGDSNISAVSLEAFDEHRTFPLAATLGKLANIVEELNDFDKAQEGLLKKFTSGGLITAERKFEHPFEFNATARITFATNVLPRFADRSNGIWRRLIIVPWDKTIPTSAQDRRLGDRLFWKSSGELPGILNWALEGLKDLNQSNQFVIPESVKKINLNYKLESNPALMFLRENYEASEDMTTVIPSEDIYTLYKTYAIANGFRPISIANLAKEIKKEFINAEQPPNAINYEGARKRVWQGIKKIGK